MIPKLGLESKLRFSLPKINSLRSYNSPQDYIGPTVNYQGHHDNRIRMKRVRPSSKYGK